MVGRHSRPRSADEVFPGRERRDVGVIVERQGRAGSVGVHERVHAAAEARVPEPGEDLGGGVEA